MAGRRRQRAIRPAIIAQGHRAEQHRKAIRGGDRLSDRHARQIGADHVESLRQKAKRAAKADIGRIDADLGAPARVEIRKSGAVKHQPVIDPRHPVVGADQRIDDPVPIPRQQKSAPDVGLDVGVKEFVGEGFERPLAIKAKMRRRKGATGDTGQQVDFVEQGAVLPFGPHRDIPACRATRRTPKAAERLPPARERHQHQRAFGAADAIDIEQAIFRIPRG